MVIKAIEKQMENHVQRMAGNGEMNQNRPEIKRMLNRVHRQTGPGADVGVSVMQRVKAVHKLRVQKAVHPIKIETFPNRDQEEDHHKPNRIG